jgi:hypothetical protein
MNLFSPGAISLDSTFNGRGGIIFGIEKKVERRMKGKQEGKIR